MKPAACLFFISATALLGQDFVAPTSRPREIVPGVEEVRPTIEGVLKDIFVTRKPWQLVNPLAPAEYGSGEKFVSRDFGPATPVHASTITVMGVEW